MIQPLTLAVTIAAAALLTFIIRLAPFLAAPGFWQRRWVRRLTAVLPVAVTAALLAPMLFLPKDELWLSADNPHLLAGMVTILAAATSRSLAGAVVVGMAAFAFLSRTG